MLPELNRKKESDARNSQPRLDLGESEGRDNRGQAKSVSAKKVRTGGGFMKSNYGQQIQLKAQLPAHKPTPQQSYSKIVKIRRTEDLSAEIKLIQRKIKACQKKLQEDRKREKQMAEEATRDKSKPQYNFEKVVERELEMQGFVYGGSEEAQQNFDYLTNPKLRPNEEEEIAEPVVEKPLIVEAKPYNIEAGIEKLQKFYENSLKKKFERREMFPHQACRRKTPKLYITQKTNALNKYGRAQNQAQHMFRVLTKQTTPQQIYPTIPNFAVVKDNLSKNIVAYLGDYKPFLDKTKEGIGKSNEKAQGEEQGQNSNAEMKSAVNVGQSKVSKDSGLGLKIEESLKINVKSKTKTNEKEAEAA